MVTFRQSALLRNCVDCFAQGQVWPIGPMTFFLRFGESRIAIGVGDLALLKWRI
jgi:hypothetical protein